MAVVQTVAGDNGAGATTVAVSISSSGSGNCLIAGVGQYGKDVTGVTDNLGQTWIQAATPGTNTEHPSIWYFPNSASGVTTVTATFSTTRASTMFVHEESGLATSSTKDKDAFSTSASATTWDTTSTTTTSQASEIALAFVASSTGSSRSFALDATSSSAGWAVVSGTGITSGHHGNTTDGDDMFMARRVLSSTGTYNCSGTCTSSIRAAAIVTFKVAASTTDAAFSETSTVTVTGTGASSVKAAGSVSSTATATGRGASLVSAAGSITSTATATGSGRASVKSAGSIAGTATATGVGKATQAAAGSVTSTATATGVGKATQAAAFTATVTATVTGYPATAILTEAAGSISATATATGVGAATAKAGGHCEVECSVIGASEEAITVRHDGPRPKKFEDDTGEVEEILRAVMPQIWSHYV